MNAFLATRDYDRFGNLYASVWRLGLKRAQVLLARASLAPGKRTVTTVLRVLALKDEKRYQNCHRFLNCALAHLHKLLKE